MLKILKRHPFPVVAHFDQVVALSFAFPEEILRPLVKQGLELDVHQGVGFVTIALVWTRQLRPKGFPAILGNDFFLVGYRIFVRFRDDSGRRLRGLQILRSETNSRKMVFLGNLMTHYNYQHVDLQVSRFDEITEIKASVDDSLKLQLRMNAETIAERLPDDSPFADWREARRFSGPMPFTFSEESPDRFVVIEGSRNQWSPRPIDVLNCQVGLFDEPSFQNVKPILANAFAVDDVDYCWKRGRLVEVKSERTGGMYD